MAKNIGSLMDKLQGLGFQASPEVAKAAEEKHEQEAVAANVPVGTIDDHNERFLAFAAAGIQLLGYDKFAQGLDKAVHWSSGDDVYNFLDRLDGAVDKRPLAEGERFRAMMGEVARRKGVPTRSGELSAVQAALPFAEEWVKRQREAERAAGRLEVPEPEEGEDLGTYRNRLDAWAAGQRGDLLKRINFDAWHIVQEEEKKREAVKAAARAKLQAQAEAELKVVLSDREYTHAVSGLSSWAQKYYELYKNDGAYNGPNFDRETVARAVVAASPWPWTLYFFWEVQPYEERGGISLYAPESVPAPADAANLTDRWVLGRVTNHDTQKSGVLLRSEVVRRWPVQSGYVRLIDVGVDRYNTPVRYAVYQDRVVKKVESSNDLPPTGPGTYLTDPNLKGWWNGRWCSPTVWQALERLNHASKGAVFITP
ncbi:hypothetical protein HYS28_02545, partial [Candidatus Uhrbacteria bacterium]|nr:hypothetical protein [Candidatus Uhrbacteria bacterium]